MTFIFSSFFFQNYEATMKDLRGGGGGVNSVHIPANQTNPRQGKQYNQ